MMQATTGVLIEARVLSLRARADADDYARALAMQVQAFSVRTRPILIADHRPVVIYPQEVAERLVELYNTRWGGKVDPVYEDFAY